MTPNTFEAYQLEGRFKPLQFIAGYVRKIKPRNSSGFISMSERVGATEGGDQIFAAGSDRVRRHRGLPPRYWLAPRAFLISWLAHPLCA